MHPIRWTWLVLSVLYVSFFSWYTSFQGPLNETEINHYLNLFQQANPDAAEADILRLRQFMQEDSGDDFVMINVIDMYDQPLAIPGVAPGESSEEVLAKYMQYMYPALFARACHPVLYGEAASFAMDLMNAPGMQRWTQGAAMRYRSRRDMLDIATNPEFGGAHEFKVAAMAKTIAFPTDPWWHLGDPRLILGLLLALLGCGISWWSATKK